MIFLEGRPCWLKSSYHDNRIHALAKTRAEVHQSKQSVLYARSAIMINCAWPAISLWDFWLAGRSVNHGHARLDGQRLAALNLLSVAFLKLLDFEAKQWRVTKNVPERAQPWVFGVPPVGGPSAGLDLGIRKFVRLRLKPAGRI